LVQKKGEFEKAKGSKETPSRNEPVQKGLGRGGNGGLGNAMRAGLGAGEDALNEEGPGRGTYTTMEKKKKKRRSVTLHKRLGGGVSGKKGVRNSARGSSSLPQKKGPAPLTYLTYHKSGTQEKGGQSGKEKEKNHNSVKEKKQF